MFFFFQIYVCFKPPGSSNTKQKQDQANEENTEEQEC